MFKIMMIGAGGGAGAVLRYLVSGWGQRLGGGVFPVGTLTVNVVGCLLIGFLAAAFAGPHLIRDEVRLALMVGLLGGFTTFSSFGYETMALVNDGQWRYALLNVTLNNGLGLLAAWAGYRFGEKWMGV
ncbi:MAG: fluoride efflux transporter CrcB [Phycisphaerae bacterium]